MWVASCAHATERHRLVRTRPHLRSKYDADPTVRHAESARDGGPGKGVRVLRGESGAARALPGARIRTAARRATHRAPVAAAADRDAERRQLRDGAARALTAEVTAVAALCGAGVCHDPARVCCEGAVSRRGPAERGVAGPLRRQVRTKPGRRARACAVRCHQQIDRGQRRRQPGVGCRKLPPVRAALCLIPSSALCKSRSSQRKGWLP